MREVARMLRAIHATGDLATARRKAGATGSKLRSQSIGEADDPVG